jgi:hypothetical protein
MRGYGLIEVWVKRGLTVYLRDRKKQKTGVVHTSALIS